MQTRIIGQQDVFKLLPMAECIRLMAEALKAESVGEAIFPLRRVQRVPGQNAFLGMMPCVHTGIGTMGAKIISVYPENHSRGYQSHQGVVLLFETGHGYPVAIIDAISITAIRTAAASGVATQALARDDAGTLAILGSSVQARSHFEAMRLIREIRKAKIWSRSRNHAEALANSLAGENDISIEVSATARDAVQGADIICTTTAATEPILRADWLEPGAHINAVGACTPVTREIDSQTVARSRVFVDCYESALNEAGEIIIAMKEGAIYKAHIRGEVGEVLLGKTAGRQSDSEITLFKSLGIAVEDIVAAHYIYERAEKNNAGVTFNFERRLDE